MLRGVDLQRLESISPTALFLKEREESVFMSRGSIIVEKEEDTIISGT